MIKPLLTLSLAAALAACAQIDAAADRLAVAPVDPPERRPAASAALRASDDARLWIIETGSTARSMLTDWCREAGYTLFWQAQVDRKIALGTALWGRFDEVVFKVFNEGFVGAPQLTPVFRHGNRALLVTQDGTLTP